MTSRNPLRFRWSCLAAWLLGASSLFGGSAGAAQEPNVVLILADDLGWADIGYNNSSVYTPNLDTLAAEGVRFAQHYAMSQCTPSRVALFTGRFPSRSGTQAQQASNDQSYPHGTLTISSMFAEMGYECYMAGKWHMGSAPEWGPNYHGFQESYGSLAGAVGMYDHRYRPGNEYEITWHRNHAIIPGYENGTHATDLVADDAIRFLNESHSGPFFMYLPFHAPHTPLDERGPFTSTPTQLDPNDNTRWLNEDLITWFNDPDGKIQAEPDPEKRLLLAAVHHLDDAVGRIVTTLDQTGQRDNTVILFSSDNGPQVNWAGNAYPDDLPLTDFNQPDTLRGSKTDVYEGGTLVPGFINWPSQIAPGVVTDSVHLVDWFPTIAALIGYTPGSNPEWDGEDIMPLITGSGTIGDRSLYWLWGSGSSRWALRYGDWKVVRYGSEPSSPQDWELYDIANDPSETTDLSSTATAELQALDAQFVLERAKDLKGKIVSPRLIGPSTVAGPFAAQITFTESVSGLDLGDFVFVNATGSALSGSGASYSFTVTPSAALGVASVVLPGGAVSAAGGRFNAPSNELRVLITDAQAYDWSLESPATAPAERVGYINVASNGSQMYVLGGKTSAGYQNDLWGYDGATWTLLDDGSGSAPDPVVNHGLAWDASRQVLVFFGAKHQDATGAVVYRDETWEWTAATGWQQITPTGSIPPPRGFHTLIYYPEAGGCVLFGGSRGSDSTALGDTWIWDGTAWTEVTGIAGPSARWDGAAVYRSAPYNDMICLGGRGSIGDETWRFVSDGTTHFWTQLGSFPEEIDNQGMYYDTRRDVVVAHGGQIGVSNAVTNRTFEFDGSIWVEVFPPTLPIVRKGQAVAWLESFGKGVMFGGTTDTANEPPPGTLGWDGVLTNETWSRLSAIGIPYCFGDAGSGTLCPCSNDNDGSVPESGCANGVFASGAQLTGSGQASLGADTLVLATTGLEPNNSGLYFQADNDLSPGILWGDGLQCAGGQLRRLGVRFSDATGYSDTSGYPLPISVKAGNVLAGDTKYYQCWYRNPTGSLCGSDFNASNGYAVTWTP